MDLFNLAQSLGVERDHLYLALQREALSPAVVLSTVAYRQSMGVATDYILHFFLAEQANDCGHSQERVRLTLWAHSKLSVLLASPHKHLAALSEGDRRNRTSSHLHRFESGEQFKFVDFAGGVCLAELVFHTQLAQLSPAKCVYLSKVVKYDAVSLASCDLCHSSAKDLEVLNYGRGVLYKSDRVFAQVFFGETKLSHIGPAPHIKTPVSSHRTCVVAACLDINDFLGTESVGGDQFRLGVTCEISMAQAS